MPEINSVIIAGNLTKDPVFRQTNSGGTPVVNFSIACNRRFRDSNHQWQEDVCYVGVVAWNKLAESCRDNLRKSSAVLVDGELQSRTWKAQDGTSRTVVEIKARRIQFLNKRRKEDGSEDEHDGFIEDDYHEGHHEGARSDENGHIYEYKYLSAD
ncbi:single-stranded DNA-binding protein [Chlorobium sp. N1]|nr:single-stranded DNA-binding protein [Chlorobium sp. N1]